MKIVFITNEDPVNRRVLSGIANSYPADNTLCFFWDDSGKPKKTRWPTPRRVLGLINSKVRDWLDSRRTNEVSRLVGPDEIKFPNEQRIESRLANSKKTAKMLAELEPNLIVVCGAPILRERIFAIPKIGTINIHFGISSAYRGQHTLLWPMLENRFDQIGATVHLIDKGVDTGNVLFEVYPDVAPDDDEVSLELKVADGIVEPFLGMLKLIERSQRQQLTGRPQGETGKVIRNRDLGWWKSLQFGAKKYLGMLRIPIISSRTEVFYDVN